MGNKNLKVYIHPRFRGRDDGDGGIRRVVEAQCKYLPQFGIDITTDPAEADLLVSHVFMPTPILKNYPDKPLVEHCHGLYWDEYKWPNWALQANEKVMETIRIADVTTAPSEWVAQVLRRHTMRDVVPIHHGIDVEDWNVNKGMGYVLWNKNRTDPVCDSRVVDSIAARMPDVPFVTTFGGKGLQNVEATGRLPFKDAKKVIENASCYLCTARETFGVGTLEALAAGVPVVGWDWGGQTEIIRNGENGMLVPVGNYELLAGAISWAIKNKGKLAAGLRKDAERYSWKNVIGEYANLYKQTTDKLSKQKPKVSVIVTVYNLGKYLPDCFKSLFNQTYTDWECIVVDDCSTDDSYEAAKSWIGKDDRFKLYKTPKNLYLSGARNFGIERSTGKYILPLDADDSLHPYALEVLANALDRDKAIHIAYGNVLFQEEDGKTWHSGWPVPFRYDHQVLSTRNTQRNIPFNLLPYCSMYRRIVWQSIRGYRSRLRTTEDADFWVRAASYGFRPEMVTAQDTLIYRNRSDGMGRTVPKRDWTDWYPWATNDSLTPAGAVSPSQVPIPTYGDPEVSIIIPVGIGHEDLVVDAIDSVDAQTYRNWECIVVDDTDGTLDPKKLPSWVKVLRTEGKEGVAAARNLGIKNSKGKCFVPLDADDYLQPRALETYVDFWYKFGGIIYSDWWQQDENGEITLFTPPDYDANLLITKGCPYAVTALYPKFAWEQVGGFNEELSAWEDWDFHLKLAKIGVCGSKISVPLFTYRKYTGYRREKNQQEFEDSKQGIIKIWKGLWEGTETLMGCHSCPGGGGAKVKLGEATKKRVVAKPNTDQSVVVIKYTGARQGSFNMRGPVTGTIYYFSMDDPIKYVFEEDLPLFLNRQDFQRTELNSPIESDNNEENSVQSGPEVVVERK